MLIDRITEAEFKTPFKELLEVRDVACSRRRLRKGSPAHAGDPTNSHLGPLAAAFFDGVSTKRAIGVGHRSRSLFSFRNEPET